MTGVLCRQFLYIFGTHRQKIRSDCSSFLLDGTPAILRRPLEMYLKLVLATLVAAVSASSLSTQVRAPADDYDGCTDIAPECTWAPVGRAYRCNCLNPDDKELVVPNPAQCRSILTKIKLTRSPAIWHGSTQAPTLPATNTKPMVTMASATTYLSTSTRHQPPWPRTMILPLSAVSTRIGIAILMGTSGQRSIKKWRIFLASTMKVSVLSDVRSGSMSRRSVLMDLFPGVERVKRRRRLESSKESGK